MSPAMSFTAALDLLRRRASLLRIEEAPVVAYDDPQRDPNYCWTHHKIYPACADMH